MHLPRYPIPPFTKPMESYCILYNAFSPKECKDIVELGELLEFKRAAVGSNQENMEVRDSSIIWIDDNPDLVRLDLRRFTIDRSISTISRVNGEKFDMDLDGFDSLQYTKYGLNQHYDWHVDVNEGQHSLVHRKLSMVVMLTDVEEYEGGDLLLNLGGNPDNPMVIRAPIGAAVFFYSHIPHKVTPVTKGTRISLVTWACGPRIR